MAIPADVSALLTKLGKLELASELLKVNFEQVAESAVAKRVAGFSRAIKKEELKRLIDSGKEEALKAADGFLNHWVEVVTQAGKKKSPVISPSSQDLRQAQGTPKEKPPSAEELKALWEKLQQYAKVTAVPFELAAAAFNAPITEASLAGMINAVSEDSRRSAALFLGTWEKEIVRKAKEIKSMQGATPKQAAPPKDMKIVEKSVAEDLGLSGDEQYILTQHNEWRKKYNKPPLQYDKRLAAHAQQWANYLAQKATQGHNPDRMVDGAQTGENIAYPSWMGTTPTKQGLFKQAVDGWGNEVSDYDFATHEPKMRGKKVGHFTQLIWRDTTRVGCGYAAVTGADGWTHGYVVCNYLRAGNATDTTPGGDPKRLYKANI